MWNTFLQELHDRGSVTFAVRAVPGASKTEAVEMLSDESVKIRIAAAPEGGKANVELIKFLAKIFAVPRSSVSIVVGATDRRKLVRIKNEQ